MILRPAEADDFAFIHQLCLDPAYAPFITDEPDAVLAAYLQNPLIALLILEEEDGSRGGFALYEGNGHGVTELRRLALAQTGGGRGRAFLSYLVDYGFAVLGAERLWLDASGENPRAMKTYEAVGFKREGILRDHWYRPALGRRVDMHLFGILRSEWQAQSCGAAAQGIHS